MATKIGRAGVCRWRLAMASLTLSVFLSEIGRGQEPAAGAAPPAGAASTPVSPAGFSADDLEFFETKIRPLLAERCFECHGPDEQTPSGGLQLRGRPGLLNGGDSGPAVVPGQPDASLLIDAINYRGLYEMPPDQPLAAAEIRLLTEWVARGAPWPEQSSSPAPSSEFDIATRKGSHWCWQPIGDPAIPVVPDPLWQPHPVDAFLRARQLAAGLHPAPPAPRSRLIRRLSLDLRGLPPSPEEVQEFLADTAPDAYPRLVDRYLASPQFGERWARHWMDLVRYAETCGHEFDYPIPEAYQYRDYLIRALNRDVPYDQLVREHLAGDLLVEPRTNPDEGYNESVIGTGFWFLGEATHSPVDVLADEAGRIDNQLDVMGKAFLGLTIGCARCHNHMFDPISTADYYGLAGFLQSSRRQLALLDPGQQIARSLLELEQFQHRADAALAALRSGWPVDAEARIERYLQVALPIAWERRARGGATAAAPRPEGSEPAAGAGPGDPIEPLVRSLADPRIDVAEHPLHFLKQILVSPEPDLAAAKRAVQAEFARRQQQAEQARTQSELFADFSHDLTGWFRSGWAFDAEPTRGWRAGGTAPEPLTAAVAGTISSGRMGGPLYGVLRSPSFVLTKKFIHHRIAGKDVQIKLVIDGYTMDGYNALLFNGASVSVDTPQQFRWVTQGQDIGNYIGHTAHLEYIDHSGGGLCLDEVRFSDDSALPSLPSAFGVAALADDWNDWSGLARYLATHWAAEIQNATPSPDAADLWQWGCEGGLLAAAREPAAHSGPRAHEPAEPSVADVLRQKLAWMQTHRIPAPRMTQAITDGTGEDEAIYIRGNPKTPGPLAPRQMISALRSEEPWQLQAADGSGRLRLAEALTAEHNPLTARVIANRVWHHLFGRGIVPSVDNFGALGDPPSHPELLDHLARYLTQHGWSLKGLIRYVVLSQAYQMDSRAEPDQAALDPTNRWLHHMPIRRLSAEAIRDSILAVSGTLDSTMYGPSVPVHLTPYMQGRGRPGNEGPLDGHGRRSIYVEIRRNFLAPMMLAFDAPIPFSCVGRRGTSNVPSQALILLNDPLVWDQAQRWAERLLDEQPNQAARLNRAFQLALGRDPSADEREAFAAFLQQQQAELQALGVPEATAERETWRDVCHVLFNSKEFYYVH